MFTWKKPQDFHSSLQRFADVGRDAGSRAKHFKLIFENLTIEEKRQLIESFGFEIYHLIDSLMLCHYGQLIEQQTIADVTAATYTTALDILEQVLLNAPEFVGIGWQRNGIEFILKMVLHPRNEIAVRKLAIRLFIIWYQILAIYGRTNHNLDVVFQCVLPHFPLNNEINTERILTPYIAKCIPILVCTSSEVDQQQQISTDITTSTREKAKTLQIYLDKFLEYIIRETIRINWSNPLQRLETARFLLDRIIVLYICELFPDASNGIDVNNGLETTFAEDVRDDKPLLETAEPETIAKYWLIRFFIRIAEPFDSTLPSCTSSSNNLQLTSERSNNNNVSSSGLPLFKQALFSSQKAINVLLTMMRESMRLPLSCVNVIQKVLALIRIWLSQSELPNFLDSKHVSTDHWTQLLLRMLFSFFRSPYLLVINDRLPSAISIAHNILKIVRDMANPSGMQIVHVSKSVWQELLKRLISVVDLCVTRSDAFGQATAAGFTRTLLGTLVFVQVLREISIDNHLWDCVLVVFQSASWKIQIIEQWSRITINITKALILNLFAIDVCSINAGVPQKVNDSIDDIPNFSENASCNNLKTSDNSSTDTCPCEAAITQNNSGLSIVWIKTWMRIICLVDTSISEWNRSQQLAVQTIATYGRAVDMLIQVGEGAQSNNEVNPLIHWLAIQVLRCALDVAPHALPIMFTILVSAQPLPPLVRVFILHRITECLHTEVAPLALEHIPSINSLEDMAIISAETISTLQRLIKNQEFSARAIRVAALLSLNHPDAEKIIISLLETRRQSQQQQQLDQFSLTLCVNALSLLILERADVVLFDRLLHLLIDHQYAARVLPLFCANIASVMRVGFHSQLIDAVQLSLSKAKNVNMLNDLKWQLCSICAKECIALQWKETLAERFENDKDNFFEGFAIRLSGQFPLPGFQITQWNSIQEAATEKDESDECNIYMETNSSILSLGREDPQMLWCRTALGRYAYQMEMIGDEEESNLSADNWLNSISDETNPLFQSTQNARQKSTLVDEIFDPFQELPFPIPRHSSQIPINLPSSTFAHKADLIPLDISVPEILQFIQSSTRFPEEVTGFNGCDHVKSETAKAELIDQLDKDDSIPDPSTGDLSKYNCWRKFNATFGFFDSAKDSPSNFYREIRHLDSTVCREVHKVAVIFVGGGNDLQDKQSILSNNTGSETFNKFYDGLGWPVHIGSSEFFGYNGGLPNGQTAIYYATANTELIFHVSTLLTGDATQRVKHLGNDEVHVVWSENTKPYRRDMIATRFCDVLIVLYLSSPVLLRVHIEVQDPRLQFGPLFDGACIHISQASTLVRETVLNASRAYRNLRVECDRPNKYRERVFRDTKKMLKPLSLSNSITRLFHASIE
uniref:Rap-GAP domain-containing protein n=1 Tax=Meloidogyne incognita TaxID=6306 RepID=A0A914L5I3_MELIC